MTTEFTFDQAAEVLADAMPGCVRDLGLQVDHLGEGRATLRMPANDQSCREGAIFSGQALAALADTAMCFALWTDGRGRRPVATVDLHVSYLRGGGGDDVIAQAEIVRAGRSLAFCKVAMALASSDTLIASAVATFSLPA